ncbi:hypothetical protein RJ639_040973 [Escallonia herrerae]|uniref:Uncharacterized protein n=1 Tax=Escallonia herrerae TaxID=1293975 RepID=A0AA89B2P6_9ASTE|nr:hypothetical protein RJ639_040973 [Escallonia herrerae]
MAICQRNDVGSILLDHRGNGGSNSGTWPSFSAASFRRRIINTMRCGGGGFRHRPSKPPADKPQKQPRPEPELRSEPKKPGGSEKLSELLRLSESSENEDEVKKKVETLEELKGVVKRLQSSDGVLLGASEVRRLAKENLAARTTLALLGAIPPLVGLLDSEGVELQIAALYGLLNLAIGNDANKAAIVKAGAVHKMLRLVESPNGCPDQAVAEAIVANFLGLSALDSNKPIIGASGAIPFLMKTLKDLGKTSSSLEKLDSLRALYNLSILPTNVLPMLETELVPFLLSLVGDMKVSERILAVLSNVVSTAEGRKTLSSVRDAFLILVDVLNWTDSPGCQEKASYILMVMAHKSYGDRQAMIEAGIASSLLELTLLGSTLAQKRASRILECLRVDKGKQVSESYGGSLGATLSAPLCGSSSSIADTNHQSKECLDEDESMMSDEKKAVKQLVQQSLQNNMRRIVKRANLPQDFVPSEHFKSFTSSSTSKSLPF